MVREGERQVHWMLRKEGRSGMVDAMSAEERNDDEISGWGDGDCLTLGRCCGLQVQIAGVGVN